MYRYQCATLLSFPVSVCDLSDMAARWYMLGGLFTYSNSTSVQRLPIPIFVTPRGGCLSQYQG